MKNSKIKWLYIFLIICPIACIILSLFIGRYPVSLVNIFQVLYYKVFGGIKSFPDVYQSVILDIRLPRAILAVLVGGSLAVSGASYQGLFRNPLVSSSILGVSSGAGFGAALAIIIFGNNYMVYLFSFMFGILSVAFSYFIGRIYKSTPAIMLVLGGVIVSSVFSALISMLKYLADPYDKLPAIVFWLMGSLANARYEDILAAALPMIAGITGLLLISWRINVLSMGDREAQTLGVNVKLTKGIVIICTTLATAGAVSVSGIIGWVGLVIPHISRMIVGNDNKILIPTSLSLGACFLLLIDNLGRVISPGEIPLGILTALVGGPFFVYLLKLTKGGGW